MLRNMAATKAPSPLNDCARLSRLGADSESPRAVTYGFAAVSRKHIPVAIMKNMPRYAQYSLIIAAGKNSSPPRAASTSPNTIPDL